MPAAKEMRERPQGQAMRERRRRGDEHASGSALTGPPSPHHG